MSAIPDPERWRRLAPLLEEAIDLPLAERAAFLDRACGGDAGLRADLEALLGADAEAGAFLDAPVDLADLDSPGAAADGESGAAAGPAPAATPGMAPLAGTTIGPYRLVREIARGGMGVVYEAEQQRPRRRVALKVILGGRHVDSETIRMFQREADSLARLKHPSIAAIYESGCTDGGQHFFAMELVHGRSLSEEMEQRGPVASRADLRRRLALFRKIAGAVAYAHQRGVIHRDLKPSNILVLPEAPAGGGAPGGSGPDSATTDGGGSTARDLAGSVPDIKVLDFGLARITDADADVTAYTALGRIQGTLPYMSPEQVRGRRDEIDIRTDVYSLGVILYRMLAGGPPYDLEGAGFPEAARIICEQAPRPLTTAAGGRLKIDRDLAIIVRKALEKDPPRRYTTVAALDTDVARYLSGQPILARRPSAAYQIGRLVTRHKIPFAAAGALLALLVGFAVVTTVQSRRIAAERDRANREAATASRVTSFLTDLFKVSDPRETPGATITVREVLDRGVEKVGSDLADEPEVQADLMLTLGRVYLNLGLFEAAGPILEQAVAARRRLLGEEHKDTLAVAQTLAYQRGEAGRLDEAEALQARVLEINRRVNGDEDPSTLMSMSNLARVHRTQGRYAEAEVLDRRALESRRRLLGEDHVDTLSSMIGLGQDLVRQRRYPEAEAIYEPALERLRKVRGEDHPITLGCLSGLAYVYGVQGRPEEAEALLRDAVDRHRRILGEDHPSTLDATEDLARLLDRQERYADAEPLYRDILDRRRRILGEDHPDTIGSMPNLANMFSVQGRYAEAEALLREALEKQRRLIGEDHPNTVSTLYNLACTTALKGDRAAALAWIDRAVTHGWAYADQMEKDRDLALLRDDPAFKAIVARARANAAKSAAAAGTTGGH